MTEFNPDTTALIVVDMQNDFAHPDGALYAPGSGEVVTDIASLTARARDVGVDVVYTKDVHSEDQFEDAHYYDEFEQWGEHVVEDSWGAQIVEELEPEEDDYVIEKPTYDAFHRTELDGYLRVNDINDLLICGTLANVCVLHTAGSAGLRDYRPVLVEDALGYIEEDDREYAVEHAEWLFGEAVERSAIAFDA